MPVLSSYSLPVSNKSRSNYFIIIVGLKDNFSDFHKICVDSFRLVNSLLTILRISSADQLGYGSAIGILFWTWTTLIPIN